MDNNNNTNTTATGTAAEGTEKETQTGAATGTNNNSAEETVTMSKADYDKAIQAAEDRLRTKYSKEIKTLQDKITELTPVQKTEAERALEQGLAELERKEKESEETLLQEMKMFIYKDGTTQASSGYHDDTVMAFAMALLGAKECPDYVDYR